MIQSISQAHPWDAGQVERPVEAVCDWALVGPHPDVTVSLDGETAPGGWKGPRVWWCFRGLQIPAGAVVTAARLEGLAVPGRAAFRVQLPEGGDADPPGGVEAVLQAWAQAGTAAAEKAGFTLAQQKAVDAFWWQATNGGWLSPETPEGMAQIMAQVAFLYDEFIVQGNDWIGPGMMTEAFGPWATSWPYNWTGWTPEGGWDLDVPTPTSDTPPDLTPLLQELVAAEGWQPGNAVLLLADASDGESEVQAMVTEAVSGDPLHPGWPPTVHPVPPRLVVEWETGI
ncbi:hypothetical protein [Megalodesulfovibrio paquesii]